MPRPCERCDGATAIASTSTTPSPVANEASPSGRIRTMAKATSLVVLAHQEERHRPSPSSRRKRSKRRSSAWSAGRAGTTEEASGGSERCHSNIDSHSGSHDVEQLGAALLDGQLRRHAGGR